MMPGFIVIINVTMLIDFIVIATMLSFIEETTQLHQSI